MADCDDGQIHVGGHAQPIVKCTSCGSRTCFTHGLPWHTGFSCEEFDLLQSNASTNKSSGSGESALETAVTTAQRLRTIENERASVSTIISTTKPCPSCRRNIEKNGGW